MKKQIWLQTEDEKLIKSFNTALEQFSDYKFEVSASDPTESLYSYILCVVDLEYVGNADKIWKTIPDYSNNIVIVASEKQKFEEFREKLYTL